MYWLAVPQGSEKKDTLVEAEITQPNHINVTSKDVSSVIVRLNDSIVNLDEPVTISFNGQVTFQGTVQRDPSVIQRTASDYCDPYMIFAAEIRVPDGPKGDQLSPQPQVPNVPPQPIPQPNQNPWGQPQVPPF